MKFKNREQRIIENLCGKVGGGKSLFALVDNDEICKAGVTRDYDLDFFVQCDDLFCDKGAAAKPASNFLVHCAHLHYNICSFELYIT